MMGKVSAEIMLRWLRGITAAFATIAVLSLVDWLNIDKYIATEPNDNAFIESFNSRLRDECLNEQWFTSLVDAQVKVEAFRLEYHMEHSHSGLGGLTPAEYGARFTPSAPAEITRLSA